MRTEEEIREELTRLSGEISRYNFLANSKPDPSESAKYYHKAQREAVRYWAIRWVMEWEKEIPE